MVFGISTDILVLGHYKYTDFFITNINGIFNTHFNLQDSRTKKRQLYQILINYSMRRRIFQD